MTIPLVRRARADKTPIASRTLIALWLFAAAPIAAAPLSEADVIRLARDRDPDVAAASAAVARAEAERRADTLRDNPSVGWDRESAAGDSEDTLALTVPIDLSSRPATRDRLGRAAVSTARAGVAAARRRAVVAALARFYQLLGARERAAIEQRAVDRLTEAVRVVTRRRTEGAASGYEQARVEIEAELAMSELRAARSREAQLRVELALLLGVDPAGLEIAGDLTPTPLPERGEPASIRELRAAERHAAGAVDGAGRGWVPTLSIAGGPRIVRAGETSVGYVAGLSIELPLFSRGRALEARARAQRREVAARVRSFERAARLDEAGALQALEDARREAGRFDGATRERVERLERAAAAGYREGERSLVELLDAGRARTEVDRRRLSLALAVKRAELAVRAARGAFE